MKYHKYEAYPSARFWVWHHSGWVKLTLKARPSCELCQGWLNSRESSRETLIGKRESYCTQCGHVQESSFQDVLRFGFSKADDEGYSFEESTFIYESGRHEPPHVIEEWANGGRDCDGSIRHSGARVCPLDRLQHSCVPDYSFKHPTRDSFNGVPILRPDWKKQGRDETYDQYAQMAGY